MLDTDHCLQTYRFVVAGFDLKVGEGGLHNCKYDIEREEGTLMSLSPDSLFFQDGSFLRGD